MELGPGTMELLVEAALGYHVIHETQVLVSRSSKAGEKQKKRKDDKTSTAGEEQKKRKDHTTEDLREDLTIPQNALPILKDLPPSLNDLPYSGTIKSIKKRHTADGKVRKSKHTAGFIDCTETFVMFQRDVYIDPQLVGWAANKSFEA